MSEADAFFDTKVLLYLLSADAAKADRAEALLADGGVISVQVLSELAAVASRKLGLAWPEIHEVLHTARAVCRVESLTVATLERGLAIAERYGFTVYDSLIVAAALLAGCRVLWTEDLQVRSSGASRDVGLHGQGREQAPMMAGLGHRVDQAGGVVRA